jgi:hypothetical protein
MLILGLMDNLNTNIPDIDKKAEAPVGKMTQFANMLYGFTQKLAWLINSIPGAATLLGIASIITVFVYLMLFIFTKYSFGGITRARNIYSGYYLITSLIIVIVTTGFANPIIDHATSEITNTTDTDKLIQEILDIINNIVNMAPLPLMIIEVLLIVIVVFIVTLMFVITSSLLRTYYAIQCPLDKKIQVMYWGKIVDIIMYCGLIMFFFLYVCFNTLIVILKSMNKTHPFCSDGLFVSKKLFIITLVYYIIQLLFSGIEYLISNNIIAIHNWRNPPKECSDNQTKEKTQSMAKNIENGFYLFLNVLLCIFIWVIIIALIAGHIYVSAVFISLDKIVSLIDIILLLLQFLISGKITLNGIEAVVNSLITKIKSIVPGKMLPKQFDTDASKMIGEFKSQLADPNSGVGKILASFKTNGSATDASTVMEGVKSQLADKNSGVSNIFASFKINGSATDASTVMEGVKSQLADKNSGVSNIFASFKK